MRSLYLRIWLTVVAALALFALVSGWLLQQHLADQRERVEGSARDRVGAWAELLQRSLPPADAAPPEQAAALDDWADRLRLPMALDDAAGRRIGATPSFQRRETELRDDAPQRLRSIRLDDGRTLWIARPGPMRGPPGARSGERAHRPWLFPRGWPDGVGIVLLLGVLFVAVAAGAWPVVRGLTRRLEALKSGVEAFGAGALDRRVAEDGRDEVAAVAASFNRAAGRIEALLQSHKSLLANASHELRSPLARLKMALAMIDDATPDQRQALKREIDTDIGELDALVEEVLLTSRLDAAVTIDASEPVPLLALVVEEAARVGASVDGDDGVVRGDERLLRRAIRNLLENARRYGGSEVGVTVATRATAGGATSGDPAARADSVEIRVCDRGPGVPEALRERIFEPFFRMPGHAEREGGVGLGLSLVRQIAERHGGAVRCEPRDGGGSCFVLTLPR